MSQSTDYKTRSLEVRRQARERLRALRAARTGSATTAVAVSSGRATIDTEVSLSPSPAAQALAASARAKNGQATADAVQRMVDDLTDDIANARHGDAELNHEDPDATLEADTNDHEASVGDDATGVASLDDEISDFSPPPAGDEDDSAAMATSTLAQIGDADGNNDGDANNDADRTDAHSAWDVEAAIDVEASGDVEAAVDNDTSPQSPNEGATSIIDDEPDSVEAPSSHDEQIGEENCDDPGSGDEEASTGDAKAMAPARALSCDDDLTALPGVGPGMIWLFGKAGVETLGQLSASDPERLQKEIGVIGQLVDVRSWIDFARAHTKA